MCIAAQTTPRVLSFEVASIKPNESKVQLKDKAAIGCRGTDSGIPSVLQGRCIVRGEALNRIVAFAFNVKNPPLPIDKIVDDGLLVTLWDVQLSHRGDEFTAGAG